MDIATSVAAGVLVVGGLYLVLASVVRSRRDASEEPVGRPILNLSDNLPQEFEPTHDRMKKLAAICASSAEQVFAGPFDFSLESVARIDRAIVAGWGDGTGEADPDVVLSFGAYLGEVLVRRTRGRWVTGLSDDDPAAVLFLAPGGDDTVSFSPFLLVREKLSSVYSFDLSMAFTALQQKLKELHAA